MTAQLNGSNTVSSVGGTVLTEAVDQRARQQLEVLGEAAVEAGALVDREVVAVDPVPVSGDDDARVPRRGRPPSTPHSAGGLRGDLLDAADDLVTGDRGELAAPGGVDVALEVVDVAVAQTGGLDPHHRAPGLRVGHREVAHLPGLVTVEDDCPAHGALLRSGPSASGTARRARRPGVGEGLAAPLVQVDQVDVRHLCPPGCRRRPETPAPSQSRSTRRTGARSRPSLPW